MIAWRAGTFQAAQRGFRVKSISSPYLRCPSECIACSWCIRTTLAAMASLTSAMSSRSAIAGSRVARPQGALRRLVWSPSDVEHPSDPPSGDPTDGSSARIRTAVRWRAQYTRALDEQLSTPGGPPLSPRRCSLAFSFDAVDLTSSLVWRRSCCSAATGIRCARRRGAS